MHPKGTWIFQKRFLFHWSFFSFQLLPTDIGHSQGKMDWEQNFESQLDAEKGLSPTYCSKLHSWNSCDDGYGYVMLKLAEAIPNYPFVSNTCSMTVHGKIWGIWLKDCTIIFIAIGKPKQICQFSALKKKSQDGISMNFHHFDIQPKQSSNLPTVGWLSR